MKLLPEQNTIKAIHKATGKMIAIPRHKGDIPTGTAHNILKEAGLK